MRRALGILVPLAAVAALAACGGSSSSSGGGGGGASGTSTVTTGSAGGQTVLTNSAGLTLYYLSTEQGGMDKCTQQAGPPSCPTVWPGVAAPSSGNPVAGSGVTGSLTVITAADGSKEVVYNGWPLHTFQNDSGPGQAGGNNIMSFGGTWYTATPALTSSGGSGGGGGGGGGGATPGASTPYGGY